MDKDLPISVIVCTCNRARHLENCLKSIYAQDHPPAEVLIVNGPSMDDTVEVASRFGARIVQQKGQGIANARNIGVKEARNNAIAFIDDDCVAAKDWLGRLTARLEDMDVHGVGGKAISARTDTVEFMNGTVDVNGTIRSKNQAPQPYDRPSGKRFNNVVCMNVAFKRQAVNAVGGFDEYFNNYFEETDLCVRMIQSGFRVVHEPDAVVWHEFATGQNRKSRWEQNWYAISRNSTYMPFKDFKGNRYVLMSIKAFHYGKRMASVTIPFMKREISFMTMQNIYSEVTRGFADGLRDGMKTRRTMAARRQ